LTRALWPLDVEVEHIGSTAIPGLKAKPIFDIAILVPPAQRKWLTNRMEEDGYVVGPDKRDHGGQFFFLEASGQSVARFHVVETGSPQWDAWISFRDRLCADPQLRDEYAALKLQLAEEYPDDQPRYTAGKEGFVRRVLEIDVPDIDLSELSV
jgi:GrpB-like predicted nucleotidyltransferase (UPF0157 family)